MSLLVKVAVSMAVGAAGAIAVFRFAERIGLIDRPNERSSHTRPIPRGGGIGIVAAFALIAAFSPVPAALALAGVAVAVVSLLDDKLDLPARVRFACQAAAAVAALYATGFAGGAAAGIAVATVFVVGTANFYNFMDGINGIAGITGAVAFSLLSGFAFSAGEGGAATIAAGISASCLGFLPLNFPRARVFMGDVGSVFLGFMFGVLALWLAKSALEFLVLISFLFTFYSDALTTLFIRWRDGEKLSQAHRRHLYQIFANELGMPHWKVTTGYGVVQLAAGLSMITAHRFGSLASIGTFLVFSAAFVAVTLIVRKKAVCAEPQQ